MKCSNCQAYVFIKQHCHRNPAVVEKLPDDWCMEFKAKEVILCPAVEKEKVEEVKVEEKVAESELEVIEERKRGWAKGKPRK